MNEQAHIPNTKNTFNLKEFIYKYIRKWYWFVLSVFVFVLIAFVYLQLVDTKYMVDATIMLRSNKPQNPFSMVGESSIFETLGFGSFGDKRIDDEIQVLRSKEILKNVIHSLEINTEYYKKDGLRYVDVYPDQPMELVIDPNTSDTLKNLLEIKINPIAKGYKIKCTYGKLKESFQVDNLNTPFNTPVGMLQILTHTTNPIQDPFKIIHYPIRHIVSKHSENIKVNEVNKRSNAILIATDAANTEKAIDIISQLIEFYNLDAVLDKNMMATNTSKFINERLTIIKQELDEAELDVENFKRKYNLTDIPTEAELLLETNIEYQKEIESIDNQLNIVTFIEDHLHSNEQSTTIPMNIGIESDALNELIAQYNEAVLMKMKMERTSKVTNPALHHINTQLEEYQKSILSSINSLKETLVITKKGLEKKDEIYFSKIKNIPTFEREFFEILRQQKIKQELYLFLMQKKEENAMTLASTLPSAKILNMPTASILPVSPRRLIILALALLFGVGIPFYAIYVYDLISNKILDKKELLRLVKAPYLGSIATVKNTNKIVVKEGATTPIIELFRLIRTNIQFMVSGKKSPVILVTSSIGGEGKSFIALNLAMSFALMNKKVVLIGLDLRKPMLGDYMQINNKTGISLYLSDDSYKLDDVITPSGYHDSLHFISAGPPPPNPGELLMNSRLDALITSLKEQFDYVLIDSAPIGKVSDTYLLNRLTDQTVYVTRQNYTPRDVSELINDLYEHEKLTNLSVVLNGVSHSSSSGYGYSYGYSKDEKKNRSFF